MKVVKYIFLVLAAGMVVIQFIRPDKNISSEQPSGDIGSVLMVPSGVQEMLRTSCYDCHSNSTRYPWYANVQPVGWWMNNHILEAKRELNFSEFASYRLRRQYKKLEEMVTQVDKEEMPLPSYLIIHTDAKFSREQKEQFIAWVNAIRDTMKSKYPPDSLMRRQ